MKNLTFYSDSRLYGGHEQMALEIMKILRDFYYINVILSSKNNIFQKMLSQEKIPYEIIDHEVGRFSIISNLFNRRAVKDVKRILVKQKSDAIVLIQGNIDISLLGGIAAKALKIPVVSYIPLAQPLRRVSRNKLLGFIKDNLRKKSFSLPDFFITISNSQKEYIERVAPQKRIEILSNFIDLSQNVSYDRNECCKEFGLPSNKHIIGYIGRFEAWHKGLDRYCKFLNDRAAFHQDVFFLFIGSGSYKAQIDSLAQRHSNIVVWDWMDDLNKVYSTVNSIIMPSRFEGVSLTMLQALSREIPIIANNTSEFREFIPEENLFNIYDLNTIERKINMLVNEGATSPLISIKDIPTKKIFKEQTLAIFKKII